MKEKSIKISYMIPDELDRKTLQPVRWKKVSLKEFKKEWLKNWAYEYIDSGYGWSNQIVLYINYKKGYEKRIDNKGLKKINC